MEDYICDIVKNMGCEGLIVLGLVYALGVVFLLWVINWDDDDNIPDPRSRD